MKETVKFPAFLFHEGTNYEAYRLLCPTPVDKEESKWLFRVWAPNAVSVSVVGDFNDWNPDVDVMEKTEGGIWEREVGKCKKFDIYKYAVETADGTVLMKSDPYALHTETAPANASKLYKSKYKWGDKKWMTRRESADPCKSPMNIYEVHLGSWKRHADGNPMSYRQTADALAEYIKVMGYTHVEIMPVAEYPFDGSWGYQVTGMFAPTSRFGEPDDFKYFVDKLHKNNVGVILDWVVAHFPRDAHGLSEFDGKPLYEYPDPRKGEHKEWGTKVFNYESKEVRSFLISSANFWLKEYHVDGIRVDAVASMLYLDYGRKDGEWVANAFGGNYNLEAIDFLKQLNTAVLSQNKGCVMIAEESTAFPLVTKPAYDGGLGFNFKWNMGWMNDTLCYVSANPFFRKDMHDKVTFAITYAFSENYILPLSHDEVVHGKNSLIGKIPGEYKEKFDGLKAFFGFAMAHPGKKLLFMGGEFGQFIEWDYKKQLDWFLLDFESHRNLLAFVRELNHYYLDHREMYELDTTYDGFRWICVDDNSQNIVSFKRLDSTGEFTIAVINFSPVERDCYSMGVPERGAYHVVLDSDSEKFGGTSPAKGVIYTAKKGEMHGEPFHIDMDIPGNSVRYLKLGRKKTRGAQPKDTGTDA